MGRVLRSGRMFVVGSLALAVVACSGGDESSTSSAAPGRLEWTAPTFTCVPEPALREGAMGVDRYAGSIAARATLTNNTSSDIPPETFQIFVRSSSPYRPDAILVGTIEGLAAGSTTTISAV